MRGRNREDPYLLLLLLSCFSRVRLCATPSTAARQAPLSLGFSRQEYWSGLPLPSPRYIHTHTHTHTNSSSLVTKLCLTLVTPWTVSHQAPLCMRFPRQQYWSGLPFPSPEDLPNPGVERRFSCISGGLFTD